LVKIVGVILEEDVKNLTCSVDKLSFRLRQLGGALRRCNTPGPEHLNLCQSILSLALKDEITHHAERRIRKMSNKLIRDVMKGKVSYYVTANSVNSESRSKVMGSPNDLSTFTVSWNIPSPEAVGFIVSVLKTTLDASVSSIMSYLDAIVMRGGGNEEGSVKHMEECTVTLLQRIFNSIHGAVEILGDDAILGSLIGKQPATGLSALDICAPADIEYLQGVRPAVLVFLQNFQDKLSTCKDASSEDAKAFASSGDVQKHWMKVFGTLVMTRMANNKGIDHAKKWYSMGKKMTSSIITKTMTKLYRHNKGDGTNAPMQSHSFWLGHDLSRKTLSDRATIQYAKRLSVMSYTCMWACCKQQEDNGYVTCLHIVVSLCQHEYDSIRSKAIKTFDHAAGRFGSKMHSLIKPLLQSISSPNTTYFEASGALGLLHLNRIQKRMTGQWDLFSAFIASFSRLQVMLSAVPEQDRREKLMGSATKLLVKYSSEWHHLPLPETSAPAELMSLALEVSSVLTTACWGDLLGGMSVCQPRQRSDEDNAQWAKGIDTILASVEYQRSVLPRSDANELDSCSFSGAFKRDNAALVSSLLQLFHPTADKPFISTLIDTSRTLAFTSESEAKAHIVTRAELFAGLYRFSHSTVYANSPTFGDVDSLLASFVMEQVDKASLDISRIWAEGVSFGFSGTPSALLHNSVIVLLDNFKAVLKPADNESAEGFSAQGKSLMLMRAMLIADTYASLKRGEVSSVATIVAQIVNADDVDIFSAYRTSREEISSILGLLVSSGTICNSEIAVVSKMAAVGQVGSGQAEEPNQMEESELVIESKVDLKGKHALETGALWLEYLAHASPLSRSVSILPSLLMLTLTGCAHKDIEVARLCQDNFLTSINSLKLLQRAPDDILSVLLEALPTLFKTASWRVREFTLVAMGVLLLNNVFLLTADEKKRCKSLFVECFLDARVELQVTAQACMTIYLSSKPVSELEGLAKAYAKNCEIMADRYYLCTLPHLSVLHFFKFLYVSVERRKRGRLVVLWTSLMTLLSAQ
jgi:hypothetical protein